MDKTDRRTSILPNQAEHDAVLMMLHQAERNRDEALQRVERALREAQQARDEVQVFTEQTTGLRRLMHCAGISPDELS